MPVRRFTSLGPVHYTWGGGTQLDDLVEEVDEYFQYGVRLKPGDVVFDVGANIGVFALHAASRCKNLRFFCFEPIPELYAALKKNFENPLLAGREHQLHNIGLTRLGGPEVLTFSYFKRLPCDTTNDLEAKRIEFDKFFESKAQAVHDQLRARLPLAGNALGAALALPIRNVLRTAATNWAFERAIGLTKLECQLATLQSVIDRGGIERIDLLKVDVEGAEFEVLKGLSRSGWSRVSQLILEGHDDHGRLRAITELLGAVGFRYVKSEQPPLAVERGLNNFVLHATQTARPAA